MGSTFPETIVVQDVDVSNRGPSKEHATYQRAELAAPEGHEILNFHLSVGAKGHSKKGHPAGGSLNSARF